MDGARLRLVEPAQEPQGMSESVYQFTCACGNPVEKPLTQIPAACPACGVVWSMEWGRSPIEIPAKATA